MTLKAIIFDVDGTLAETERVHRAAFNQTFAAHGLTWYWTKPLYKELLTVTGGKERMRFFQAHYQPEDQLSDKDIASLHQEKNDRYSELLQSQASFRPGIGALMADALRANVKLAIATTTTEANITALARAIGDEFPLHRFDVVVGGGQVRDKKPHPEVYLRVLRQLGVDPANAIALEDSEPGLQSAKRAGLTCLVTPSEFMQDHDFPNADGLASQLPERGGLSLLEDVLSHSIDRVVHSRIV